MGLKNLIHKYSVAGPRYTSYPTAPQFTDTFGPKEYYAQLERALVKNTDPVALYFHLPFCESLCYYCGCNIQITHDHSKSGRYVDTVIKELENTAKFTGRQTVSQIAWGGGTPTFLTAEEIKRLQEATLRLYPLAEGAEVSIEIDPRVTSRDQLEVLREVGFTRVSLGVQDFNPEVQKAVNRVQTAEMTGEMLRFCRSLGYSGINFDLIYGLPLQTLDTFSSTVEDVIRMRPDRIALYNYAHLPSLRPHQKILEKLAMPNADQRVEIFSKAFERLTSSGYVSIGMDHFALAEDELAKAVKTRKLYRNFQGYSIKRGASLIGFGASAIGEIGDSFFQNIREPKEYEEKIAKDQCAVFRGFILSEEDIRRKWIIQSLMCRFVLDPSEFKIRFGTDLLKDYAVEMEALDGFISDGIIEKESGKVFVTELGRLFVRNVAMQFDAYLKKPSTATYSKTV